MEKRQFDELLGGQQKLPSEAHVQNFLSARASEIAQITHELENPQQTKRIFQKLPAQMRRRVMSHNAKRLPRHLREIHIKQMAKAGLPPKQKTPSRKHRRRPRNLLSEYNRRQRKKFWLETHIWHAKRFKVCDRFGFKIPLHSNDRNFRANYRAIKEHCLVQDISYYTCVELTGQRKVLLDVLKHHCGSNSLTFAAKCYAKGEREGSLMFFRYKSYPKGPLGNVHFLWNPISREDETEKRSLWIWIHPAFYNDLIKELICSFNFVIDCEEDKSIKQVEAEMREKIWDDVSEMPPMFEVLKKVKSPVYQNENNCQLVVLKNNLNRFRLCGPLALSILNDALRCPQLRQSDSEMKAESSLWFQKYYSDENNCRSFQVQRKTIESVADLKPGNLPPNMVLGLSVLDPRFYLPLKRDKIRPDGNQEVRILKPPEMGNNSPLWSKEMRDAATEEFVPSSEVNKIRSGKLVPGVQYDDLISQDVMRKIPILLIQKTGVTGKSLIVNNKSHGFGSGIDVIIPACWSIPFWLSFILRCAKPGGLRESLMTCYESENLSSPDYYHDPDTEAYKREASLQKKELTEAYFRRPPNRRVNFVKYKVADPFYCNWSLLSKEWSGSCEYIVYRNYQVLRTLQGLLMGMKLPVPVLDNEPFFENCLISVKVTLMNGGAPKDFAMICLPSASDKVMINITKNWKGFMQEQGKDPFETKRIKLRSKHRLFLKRLKRKRIRACKQIKQMNLHPQVIQKLVKSMREKSVQVANKHIVQQAKTMSAMFLPEAKSVRFEGDRETFGFVTKGSYCYSNAIGVGIGYVVGTVLFDLIKRKENHVLVRNTTSKMYRLARIEIII